jgi:hypothetical protein
LYTRPAGFQKFMIIPPLGEGAVALGICPGLDQITFDREASLIRYHIMHKRI